MFRTSTVGKWLVAGLFTASLSMPQWLHAADAPTLIIESDDEPQSFNGRATSSLSILE